MKAFQAIKKGLVEVWVEFFGYGCASDCSGKPCLGLCVMFVGRACLTGRQGGDEGATAALQT